MQSTSTHRFAKTFSEATPYGAPNHRAVDSVRLQGFEPDGPQTFWVGHSDIHPGGGAGPDQSPLEKVYVILQGTLTLIMDGQERALTTMDSCCIPAGVEREIINRTDTVVKMIVVMPMPKAAS